MKSKFEYKTIDLNLLNVNIENSRFEPQNNQREAIAEMFDRLQEKMVELAEDIVHNNLNPSELPIIGPSNIPDKYEVLEQILDKKGRTVYKRKGVIKVDKKNIWDNRFMAAEEQEAKKDKDKPQPDYTIFKGGKNFYKGMLIRQIN